MRLAGLRIVVTRAAHQAEELAKPLRELGAEVLLVPVVGIAPPADLGPLRDAVTRADEYDWIIFTSVNGVKAFAAELGRSNAKCKTRVATVGLATREAAEEHGFTVALVPEQYVAESLAEAFANHDVNGRRILIPSATVTRDVVPVELRKRGAHVDVVEAYRNVIPPEAAERAGNVFRAPYPDWVTFASSSAVDNLVQLIGTEPLRAVRIATIGPVTSATVRKHRLDVAAESDPHTIEGLVKAVEEHD